MGHRRAHKFALRAGITVFENSVYCYVAWFEEGQGKVEHEDIAKKEKKNIVHCGGTLLWQSVIVCFMIQPFLWYKSVADNVFAKLPSA